MTTNEVNACVSEGDFVVPDIVEEHFDELVFLSIQRRKLLFSPDATRRQFARHLDRLQAHWDGLRVAGAFALELIEKALTEGDPWETTVAVQGWLRLAPPGSERVLAALFESESENRSGWMEGLRHCPRERIENALPPPEAPDETLAVQVDAWLWHGLLSARSVAELATHPQPEVRAAVARQLAWAPGGSALLTALLDDDDTAVWRRATWSTALLDPARALQEARTRLLGNRDPFAVRLVGLLGDAGDLGRLRDATRDPGCCLAALFALGDLGQTGAIGTLIDRLDDEDEERSGAAAASICAIIGEVPTPEADDAEPRGASGEVEADLLPTPAQQGRRAWAAISERFPPGVRWRRGRRVPFEGDAEQEPMESIWRSTVSTSAAAAEEWLRREVPDGFFSGLPDEEALPGE